MGVGVRVSSVDVGPLQPTHPYPAQAPNVFVLIGAARRCHHIITSVWGRNKGGWEGLERPSPPNRSRPLQRSALLANCPAELWTSQFSHSCSCLYNRGTIQPISTVNASTIPVTSHLPLGYNRAPQALPS